MVTAYTHVYTTEKLDDTASKTFAKSASKADEYKEC
jgi:hypothetical protein